jgi:hypothetical protein
MSDDSAPEHAVARAARTPLARRTLSELATSIEPTELSALLGAALDADEVHAATAFGLVAALEKRTLPATLLRRLLPEVDTIAGFAALLSTCSDDELVGLVCGLCSNELLTSEREELSLFVACVRRPGRDAPRELLARVRRVLRRRSWGGSSLLLLVAASTLDDPHVATLMSSVASAMPKAALEQERARVLRLFVEDVTSLLPTEPPPKTIQGYTYVRPDREPGRNDLCPCGSGKKYKRCCALRRDERPEQQISETGFHKGLLQPGTARRIANGQFDQFRAAELARFAPSELSDMQLVIALRSLCVFGRFEAAEAMLSELVTREGRFGEAAADHREELIDKALVMRRMDVVERQLALFDPAVAIEPRVRVRIGLANERSELWSLIEERARTGLSGDPEAIYEIAYALLDFSPALGILVARGAFNAERGFDNETLYESILEARDDLGFEPNDAYGDILDALAERNTQMLSHATSRDATQSESDEDLARTRSDMQQARAHGFALEQQLRAREQAFKVLEARNAALQQQLEQADSAQTLAAVSSLKSEIEQLQADWRVQRNRIHELKATIREGAEQRRALRKQVAQAVSPSVSQAATRASSRQDESHEPDADMLEEVAPESRYPLRSQVFSPRAHEQLAELPRDVAARALALCAALAAGQPHAFVAIKRLKRVSEVYAARIDLGHRLLFRLSPSELQIAEVIDRRDLEQAIERLRTGAKRAT